MKTLPAGTPSTRQKPHAGGNAGRKKIPSLASVARRRWLVGFTKRTLPVAAVMLLACLALWPELTRDADRARMSYRRGTVSPQGGQLKGARYNGVDSHGQPYTLTAVTANQVGPDRFDMTDPIGDLTLNSGGWLSVTGLTGVYMQTAAQLDLSGNVTLYRDDGTTLHTDTATLDVHAGVATSADRTHVEGPFGTLDAQGFVVTDHGQLIRFAGPGRLVLNGATK
ncbi:MAG TPA: LPS export ABC transporter periplasmic protein LptC [Acetobacteraceae bacterium]